MIIILNFGHMEVSNNHPSVLTLKLQRHAYVRKYCLWL